MGKKRRLANVGAVSTTPHSTVEDEPKNDHGRSETSQVEGSSSLSLSLSQSRSPLPDQHLTPTRHTDGLYASQTTVDCTMNRDCVPCAYKIGCFDVALDKEFCKATPNQRPEQCPQSHYRNNNRNVSNGNSNNSSNNNGVLGFRRGMSVLTVGDGDFSFSLGLARRLLPNDGDPGSSKATFLVATSYESESTLRKVYPDFDATLRELIDLGAHVAYNVDATRILETLSLPEIEIATADRTNAYATESQKYNRKRPSLERRFHRICWNFPCTAIAKGQDGQNTAMEDNKELVRNFVQSSRSVLTDRGDGELYVCHKTKPPFNQWNLEEVALETQNRQTQKHKKHDTRPLLCYSGRIVLDRFLLPPYTPRKALDKKSFPCHDACFYVFAQQGPHTDESSASESKKQKLFLPTIPRQNASMDADREARDGGDERANPNSTTDTTLIKIEPELIRRIRQKHIKKCKCKNKTNPRKKRKHSAKHFQKGGV